MWFTVPRCLRLVREQAVAVVEEQHTELLDAFARQFRVQVVHQPVPVGQHRLVDHLGAQQPQCRGMHRLQRGDARIAQCPRPRAGPGRAPRSRGRSCRSVSAAPVPAVWYRDAAARTARSPASRDPPAPRAGGQQTLAQPPAVARRHRSASAARGGGASNRSRPRRARREREGWGDGLPPRRLAEAA